MPNSPVIRLSFPEPDIALLTLDDPKKGANVLSSHVLEELSAHLDALEKRNDLAGLVIRSGKPGSFIAGADLREFASSFEMPKSEIVEMCHRGRKLFQRLSKCPFVTVAAIDGICVGGGAELAIWCDRRVMADDPKTQFGFPEVKLGLFPGWGGTARASRIVGLVERRGNGHERRERRCPHGVQDGFGDRCCAGDRIQDAAIRLDSRRAANRSSISTIASAGAGRSISMKRNLVFSAPRLPATSSSKPRDSIRRRWRRWK